MVFRQRNGLHKFYKRMAMTPHEKRKKAIKENALKTATPEKATKISDTDSIAKKSVKSMMIDFSKFQQNNWIRDSAKDNATLQEIDNQGGALWMNPAGEIYFRRSKEEILSKLANDKAKMVLSNFLDRSSILLFKGTGTGENAIEPDVASNDVYMVMEKFTPFAPSEFYFDGRVWNRTSFKPSQYLKMEVGEYQDTPTISKLIKHLCNYDEVHYRWVINWLAGFFQSLKTSDVALVLRGAEGTGKGLLMEQIIAPLFGEDFSVTVDDDRLNSNFKGWIGEKLFFNLNEIAHDGKTRRAVINFIKVLITDRLVQMEVKNRDAVATEIFGNILITSNEVSPLEISVTDRRFTVFQTAGNIKKAGWDTNETVSNIKKELKDFAVMLKSYKVDWVLYDEALDTTAKRNIVMSTNDRYALFLTAIKAKDLDYFHLLTDDSSIIDELKTIFERGDISTREITHLFNETHNDNDDTVPTRAIMKKMRGLDVNMFELKDGKPVRGRKVMGDHYFTI